MSTWRTTTKSGRRHNGAGARRNRRPTHPGAILREDVLPAVGLTQTQFAGLLGVSRRTVHELLHERRPVTTDMAHRLARVVGSNPEFWLRLQQAVDLWETWQAHQREYVRMMPLAGLAAVEGH